MLRDRRAWSPSIFTSVYLCGIGWDPQVIFIQAEGSLGVKGPTPWNVRVDDLVQ